MYEQSWLNLAVAAVLGNYNILSDDYNWSMNVHDWTIGDTTKLLHVPGISQKERNAKLTELWDKWEIK